MDTKREVKFRSWDKEAGKYVYSDEESEYCAWGFEKGKLKCWGIRIRYSSMEAPQPESYELGEPEQFIGLFDPTGKNIFNGDIMKFWDNSLKRIRYEKVYFKAGAYWVNGREGQYGWGTIAGNITENLLVKL